ncbi:MAG: organic solvent tolerance protein OstA [Desulfovibrionaceae bacterium]|nr:organic solvent tolerance protein OstA [Desulfovibrionaceae bacterium]
MRKVFGFVIISVITAALFLLDGICFQSSCAQNIQDAKSEGSQLPTDITANHMRYDANNKLIIFEGSVKVRRPDFDLDSNKLTIYFKDNAKAAPEATDDPLSTMGGGDIDRLVAEGKVVMLRDGRKGTCGKVTYYADKELIVMEQNPQLSEDKNTVSGQKINFYVRENRSEVIGSEAKPVKVHITSPKPTQGE